MLPEMGGKRFLAGFFADSAEFGVAKEELPSALSTESGGSSRGAIIVAYHRPSARDRP